MPPSQCLAPAEAYLHISHEQLADMKIHSLEHGHSALRVRQGLRVNSTSAAEALQPEVTRRKCAKKLISFQQVVVASENQWGNRSCQAPYRWGPPSSLCGWQSQDWSLSPAEGNENLDHAISIFCAVGCPCLARHRDGQQSTDMQVVFRISIGMSQTRSRYERQAAFHLDSEGLYLASRGRISSSTWLSRARHIVLGGCLEQRYCKAGHCWGIVICLSAVGCVEEIRWDTVFKHSATLNLFYSKR